MYLDKKNNEKLQLNVKNRYAVNCGIEQKLRKTASWKEK